jgi:hypothetical protein
MFSAENGVHSEKKEPVIANEVKQSFRTAIQQIASGFALPMTPELTFLSGLKS